MARKPKTPDPFDDLAAGIEPEVEQPVEEELVKVIEPPAPQNRFGIVVEDLDIEAITGAKAAPDPREPPEPDHEVEVDLSHLSPSARERTLAEMALGRANLLKLKAGT